MSYFVCTSVSDQPDILDIQTVINGKLIQSLKIAFNNYYRYHSDLITGTENNIINNIFIS